MLPKWRKIVMTMRIVMRTKYRGAAAEIEDDCDEDDTEVDNEYPTTIVPLHKNFITGKFPNLW